MKIFGWDGGVDGCSFYRVHLPLTAMRDLDHQTAWHSTWSEVDPKTGKPSMVAQMHPWMKSPDVLIGQRIANDGPSGLWQQVCKEASFRCIYEFDDNFFDVDGSNPGAGFYSKPSVRKNIADNIAAAHHVTVSTEALVDVAMACGASSISLIPNSVPEYLTKAKRAKSRADRVTVGWAGSGTHSMDWQHSGKAIAHALRRLGDSVDVHIIGSPVAGLKANRFTRWQSSVPAFWKTIDFDIGLAPLRPHPFNRSKSAIKALEYGALGIPTIASDFGPYSDYIEHGVTGFLVRRDHEWAGYLRTLIEDRALRLKMGAAAKRKAKKWTIERAASSWERAYLG